MCLTTIMRTPFTAKKDFVVYKMLTKNDNGGFMTPCQEILVDLNDTLKPNTRIPKFLKLNKHFCFDIKGGAIHAYTTISREVKMFMHYRDRLFKAIVRKGTKFYVNTNGTEIAAEELYITDEEPTKAEIAETQEYIAQELIAAAEQHNGVRVGDFLLSDKSFVHVEDYKDDGSMTAIGVVGYFIDEKPISVGLKTKKLQWSLENVEEEPSVTVEVFEYKAYMDYNGREYTDKLYAAYKDRLDDFPALKYCVEYETEGTKKGDWYFPSSGEIANIGRNVAIVNYSLGKINSTKMIEKVTRYWCSANGMVGSAWFGFMYDADIKNYVSKWFCYDVCPVISN